MIFVDTNYFLRFLLKDHAEHKDRARELFEDGADGKVDLCTSTIVFFEIYWVLTSFYGKQKGDTVRILEDVLAMAFIMVPERERLRKALRFFAESAFDLEDSYNLIFAQEYRVRTFETFDKTLAKRFASFA